MIRKNTAFYQKSLRLEPISPNLSPIQAILSVRSIRRARSVLRLSQSDLGKAIGRILESEPVEQGTISLWESGEKKTDDAYIQAVGRLLATWLAKAMGRDDVALFRIAHSSPWKVIPAAKCRCGKWYRLRSKRQFDCGAHIASQKHKR